MAATKWDRLNLADVAAYQPPHPLLAVLERRRPTRVLDVGCGRGELVLWLRERGHDAHGVDIEPGYLAAGRPLADELGHPGVLHSSTDDLSGFDLVVSNQVLEHVTDLSALTREMARLTAPGGVGLHIFPAKWRPIEPHLHMPAVHWFRGRIRRALVALWLRLGRDPGWGDLDRYVDYLDEHTRYRSVREIRRTFAAAGLAARVDMRGHRFERRLPGWLIAQIVTVQLEVTRSRSSR